MSKLIDRSAGERMRLSRYMSAITLALLLTVAIWQPVLAEPLRAPRGTILSLTATDGPNYGDTIQVSSRVQAIDRVVTSNLFYQIIAPDGATVVATHRTSLPTLEAGGTFSDSWSTSNSTFPSMGTYTVRLCWSAGNSKNCDIASAQTTFYSVPTLGWGLTVVGLGLLGVWLWHRRLEFKPEVI